MNVRWQTEALIALLTVQICVQPQQMGMRRSIIQNLPLKMALLSPMASHKPMVLQTHSHQVCVHLWSALLLVHALRIVNCSS